MIGTKTKYLGFDLVSLGKVCKSLEDFFDKILTIP